MRILSLDLGTNTGWAVGQDGVLTDCGTWKLATAKEIALAGKNRMNRRLDPRVSELWKNLLKTQFSGPSLDWVVFEDVEFTTHRMQAQLWPTWRAVVWMFALMHHNVKVECLGVKKLKLFGANHGGATKEMMAAALVKQDPRFVMEKGLVKDMVSGTLLTDDAVDAIFLLKWAMKTFKNT